MTEEQIPQGLSSAQIQEQIAAGHLNVDAGVKTRSIGDIFRANICTLFNLINVILAILVFLTGSYKNMLFMLVIIFNVIIGIVQEIRSKITTDKLAIIAASKITVVRDGHTEEIAIDQLVLGDVIRLGRGDQVPADAIVIQGTCKANESLLTGESKLIEKQRDDELMSGSFINEGVVWARVIHVGADNYASKITNEAKQHKAVNSEIMTSLNAIIKYVSIFMFPVGALLFASDYFLRHTELNSTILSTTSAMIGMIPEGLILLTSTVLAVAVIRLARKKVLVQQLYCIETLARVDVLCLDKTGTITTGGMEVFKVEPAVGSDSTEDSLSSIFASLAAADPDPNETARAIREFFATPTTSLIKKQRQKKSKAQPETTTSANGAAAASSYRVDIVQPTRVIPFSSDVKWSGAEFDNGHAYVMGAAQFVLAANTPALEALSEQLKELTTNARVLLLAQVDGFTSEGKIAGIPTPLGFICIRDQIRPTAAQTIQYFKEQGVELKVISGDDPHTVSGIAQKVGIPHADAYVDATTLVNGEQIAEAIEHYSVFGRVRPEQKKAFVIALQEQGHIVAMTGDGVNDVLALKASDCSVAMASGSDAARNISQLVLVDNDFASMPAVVAEGRRSINNLQRSASLFLVKTLLSIVSALLFIFLPWQYPFVPIQMTLISAFTIGIPSFILALEPNHDLVRGRFLINCVIRSLPGALCGVVSIVAINAIGYMALELDYTQVSTLCVLIIAAIGIMLVIRLSIPFTPIRWALLVVVVAGPILGATMFDWLFNLADFDTTMYVMYGCFIVLNIVVFNILYTFFNREYAKRIAIKSSDEISDKATEYRKR